MVEAARRPLSRIPVRPLAALLAVPLVALGHPAEAAEQCHVIDIEFQAGELPSAPMKVPVQVVAWLEDASGTYRQTVMITRQTGTFGLGNRPGRYDFNSGPMWPYGRRTTVFPVWAHRYEAYRAATNAHPPWPQVVFQDGDDDNLSHSLNQSSNEMRFCRPMMRSESKWAQADAGTCASMVYTDKGKYGTGTSLYPPRADLVRSAPDHASVDGYKASNPFDAISQASPISNQRTSISWSIPPELPSGNYVMWLEVSREFDQNASYSTASLPEPTGIPWADYGEPYRGQPSVLYKVPFVIGDAQTTSQTTSYAGYGDPTGDDGNVRPPDATITADVPGSGAQRFVMTPEGYRVRVTSYPLNDDIAPAAPASPEVTDLTTTGATITFTAPGDDGLTGRAQGYEIRLRAGEPITEANFADSMPVDWVGVPGAPGELQSLAIEKLLFDTEYYVAIRAYDNCRNYGPITVVPFRTLDRVSGEVDACFIATAAYGSLMANDVEMLRRFRDLLLDETVLGELAVETYYTFGPAVAGMVGESELLRATARSILDPIVRTVRSLSF
ncbi:MAG: CFI-box-CTERM domain-containing protein [Kofleriaceae bacterium]